MAPDDEKPPDDTADTLDTKPTGASDETPQPAEGALARSMRLHREARSASQAARPISTEETAFARNMRVHRERRNAVPGVTADETSGTNQAPVAASAVDAHQPTASMKRHHLGPMLALVAIALIVVGVAWKSSSSGGSEGGGNRVSITCDDFMHTGGNPWTQESTIAALTYCTIDGMTEDYARMYDTITVVQL